MAETTTITVRIPKELAEKLARLAGHTRRSRSFLAAEAIDAYVRAEIALVESIIEADADFDAGRFFTTAEVNAHLAAARDARTPKREASPPKPGSKKRAAA